LNTIFLTKYLITAALLVPVLPFAAFLIIVALTKKLNLVSSTISILAMGASFLLSCLILYALLSVKMSFEYNIPWLHIGDIKWDIGILINPLTGIMLMVVTVVSLLVQIYSVGYMHGDRTYPKFFAFISLFSFSMLGLVLANNFIQIYIFWELVGLCSYLLIGFWYEKPEASDAAKKAFVVTRFGDFGFLIGILILSYLAKTFNFHEAENFVKSGVASGSLTPKMILIIALLLFSGAMGKSGQFPLHVWLPDAMEGPTPVSALIHAATMVAAGVFMVARLFGIFSSSHEAMLVIAYIGAFTAIFSASIALTQDDIKRVLAYSTLSQLGYMMLALGVGGYTTGMFHLTTHAAFKALLFLCAGSVIHAMDTNDIWKMGGLGKKMPITAATFLIAALAISGIFPLAGFWSKDEILEATLSSGHMLLYYSALITAFMTAFYMFRIFFVTFTGKGNEEHGHESPASMTIPLIILALLSICAGFIGIPGQNASIYNFLYLGEAPVAPEFNMKIAVTSNIVAVAGILLAFIIYSAKLIKAETVKKMTGPLYVLSKRKFFIDEIYLFVIKYTFLAVSKIIAWFDRHIVDGAVNLVAFLCRWSGSKLKLTISGKVQNYALIIFSGLVIVILVFAIYNPEALKIFGGK
jgi:NADH-quinone oxidoreductase subunit L